MKGLNQVKEEIRRVVKESKPQIEQMIQQTKQVAQASASAIKPAIQEMKKYGFETKQTTAQQQLLINKLNKLKEKQKELQFLNNARSSLTGTGNAMIVSKEEYETMRKLGIAMDDIGRKSSMLKLNSDIEKTENQLRKLQQEPQKVANETNQSFSNMSKSVKRFVFNLLSVASIYSLISRGMSSYLATNDEANAKYELTSNLIGNMLAPAMKVLLDMIQYVVIGVALLIKMFTGFDALANVTTKNMKNATKATKEFNKELAPMDEITNLSGKNTGTGLDFTADLSALSDFQKKIKEVEDLFKKWDVEGFVGKLQDLWDWIVKNKTAIIILGTAVGTVFAIAKVSGWVNAIATFLGAGGTAGAGASGLIGLGTTMLWVAGIIAAGFLTVKIIGDIGKIVQGMKELEDAVQKNLEMTENQKEQTDELIKSYQTAESQDKINTETKNKYVEGLKNSIETMKKESDSLEKSKTVFGIFDDTNNKVTKSQEKLKEAMEKSREEIERVTGTKYELNMETKVKTNSWDNFVSGVSKFFSNINLSKIFNFPSFSLPHFATGNVATRPTLGVFGEYANAKSDPEITSPRSIMQETMLDTFSTILPSLQSTGNQGEAVFNIDSKEFARATFRAYQDEEKRVGTSKIITRRS